MHNKLLVGFLFLASTCGVFAQGNSQGVDERALKATAPVTQRTVLQPFNVANFSGTNVGGPEWVRPFADGTCCSGLGPVRYTTQLFSLSSNDTCDIESIQDQWDGYLFIYRAPFDPLAQTLNFVAGDDDGNGGIGTSNIDGLALTGGTTYVAVTTGFEIGEEGTFANSINCPNATVTLGGAETLPIPSTSGMGMTLLIALMALIGLGGMLVRTRQ